MEERYTVKVVDSSFELSQKDKIRYKHMDDCESLEELTRVDALLIDSPEWVIVEVYNPNAKEGQSKTYTRMYVIDKDGSVYKTGSSSFMSTFRDIYDDMYDEHEPWQLKVLQKPSKNFNGKNYLTCSVV